MFRLNALLILSLWCSVAYGQVFFSKKCSNLTAINDFNVTQYLGKWYETYKYAPFGSQINTKCAKVVLYNYDNNGTFSVNTTRITGVRQTTENLSGKGKFVGNSTVAKYKLSFPSRFLRRVRYSSTHLVLGTDYTNYAVEYTCNNVSFFGSLQTVWIYTRTQTPTQEVLNNALAVLVRSGLARNQLAATTQVNCD